MPTVISLVTFELPNMNGVAKDAARMQVVTQASDFWAATDLEAMAEKLFDTVHTGATNAMGHYLASCLDPATTIRAYDISAHLDGGPHGSPYVSAAITRTATGGDSRGNAQCAVINWHSLDYATTPNNGPVGAIPTPESAQDMGAPATHSGVTKLKARKANRMYFGPLDGSTIGVDGDGNPQFTDTFMTDAQKNFGGFFLTDGFGVHVWSRRDSGVHAIGGGWVDRGIKIRRTKGFSPGTRTTFP